MSNVLGNILSGAKSALSSDDGPGTTFAGDGGPVVDLRKASPITQPTPAPDVAPTPAPKPIVKPLPKPGVAHVVRNEKGEPIGLDTSSISATTDEDRPPKRIAFPSGVVVETPGTWADESVNNFAREVHAAATTVLGLPQGFYHAAADPESPEESQKFGRGFEKKIGPTGRLIDRSVVQPLVTAIEDYKNGKVSIDDVLQNLPEAIGGGGGAVVAGKIAADLTTPSSKAASEVPTDEAGTLAANRKPGTKADYVKPLPKGLRGADLVDWLNENMHPEAKRISAMHEIAHYDYAKQAGHPSEDAGFIIGHEAQAKGVSQGRVLTSNEFWRGLLKKAKTPEAKTAAADAFLKHVYAPEVVEEMHGVPPDKVAEVTRSDRATADKFMSQMKLDPEATRTKVLNQLRQEITPQTLKRYGHAADQVVNNHYGKYVSPWVVDHFLDGGVNEDIADRIAIEDERLYNSGSNTGVPEFEMPSLKELLGRK